MVHAAVGITRALGLVSGATAHPFDATSSPAIEDRSAGTLPTTAALLSVYRRKNARSVTHLVAQSREAGMDVALWALDEPIASLAPFTVGAGPGLRMDLLNRLWAIVSRATYEQVMIADDDIVVADVVSNQHSAFSNQPGQTGEPRPVGRGWRSHRPARGSAALRDALPPKAPAEC